MRKIKINGAMEPQSRNKTIKKANLQIFVHAFSKFYGNRKALETIFSNSEYP